MKNRIKSIFRSPNYYILGSISMLFLLVLLQCNKNDDPLFDDYKQTELKMNVDYKAINKASDEIEKLFKEGNQEALVELMFEDAFTDNKYKPQYSTEEIETIAKAFKKRKLTTATDDFAEFTYSIDGKDYTLTIGQLEEGVWKIIRY